VTGAVTLSNRSQYKGTAKNREIIHLNIPTIRLESILVRVKEEKRREEKRREEKRREE